MTPYCPILPQYEVPGHATSSAGDFHPRLAEEDGCRLGSGGAAESRGSGFRVKVLGFRVQGCFSAQVLEIRSILRDTATRFSRRWLLAWKAHALTYHIGVMLGLHWGYIGVIFHNRSLETCISYV